MKLKKKTQNEKSEPGVENNKFYLRQGREMLPP